MNRKRSSWLVSVVLMVGLLFTSSSSLLYAGSAVGNGGDIFSQYVESSRFALKESIRKLSQNPGDFAGLCETESDLVAAQKTECRDFISQTLSQMLDLHERPPVPQFLLRDTPLLVIGPDGNSREVDARTSLGSSGDIELNYDRVKFYSPFQMLQILTHESGHKVLYHGQNVQDNPPTLSFATGRGLLDSVGIAMATYAQKKQLIGSSFKLLDHFSCAITTAAGAIPMGSSGFTSRTFFNLQDFGRYETGIGMTPGNLDVYLIEPGFSEIHFRAVIHEEDSCSSTSQAPRWTQLSLVRVRPEPGREILAEEILSETLINHWNPVCDDSDARKTMELSYGNFHFACQYTGSAGASSQD